MKFTIANREVDAGLGHFLLALGLLCIVFFLDIALSAVLALAMGGSDFFTAFIYASMWVATILSIVFEPFAALLLTYGGRRMKLKQDAPFCLSAAAALSILIGATVVLVLGTFILLDALAHRFPFSGYTSYTFPIFGLPYIAGVVLGQAAGAVTLYLWLLIFLKSDTGRLKSAAANAALFALGVIALMEAGRFVAGYAAGTTPGLELGLATAKDFIMYFFLGLPILYHTVGRKLDVEAAKFYALTYIGSVAAFATHNALLGPVPETEILVSLLRPFLVLGLLFAISRSKDISF